MTDINQLIRYLISVGILAVAVTAFVYIRIVWGKKGV